MTSDVKCILSRIIWHVLRNPRGNFSLKIRSYWEWHEKRWERYIQARYGQKTRLFLANDFYKYSTELHQYILWGTLEISELPNHKLLSTRICFTVHYELLYNSQPCSSVLWSLSRGSYTKTITAKLEWIQEIILAILQPFIYIFSWTLIKF